MTGKEGDDGTHPQVPLQPSGANKAKPVRQIPARVGRQLRDAFAGLFDQSTPFGRLALTHVLMTAGDTLLTVSLAGSLFFSISPQAAKGRVLLYLLLTIAPFGLVAPFIGKVVDRSSDARRAVVVASAAARVLICVFLAADINGPLLFPEAFLMLVFSKVYLVTKGALVPLFAETQSSPNASGWSRSQSAAAGQAPADPPGLPPGEPWVQASPGPVADPGDALATLNARLGLLASLAGFAASIPAVLVLKLLGGGWVVRLDILVFMAAAVAGLRLPIRRLRRTAGSDLGSAGAAGAFKVSSRTSAGAGSADRVLLPTVFSAPPEVQLARAAMSLLKGAVGFLTMFLAFALRQEHAATWWFGLMLGASVAGSVVGVLAVPRLRTVFSEQRLLGGAVWAVALAAAVAAAVGGRLIQAAMALSVGIAGSVGKPAFDALVQRYVEHNEQGRAFARFETWFQLVWVMGALIPVAVPLGLKPGDIIITAVGVVGGLFYLTARRAVVGGVSKRASSPVRRLDGTARRGGDHRTGRSTHG